MRDLQVCRRRRDRRGPARRGAWIQAAAAARRVDRQDAAARFAPDWNKKKLAELLTNRISLDIFGYTRCGNVPAPKNEGKQMITLDYNLIKYALEYASKKMDDYIKEVEAMDAPAVVKDLVIENHQLRKRQFLSMLEKFDNSDEDNLLLMTDDEFDNFIEKQQE